MGDLVKHAGEAMVPAGPQDSAALDRVEPGSLVASGNAPAGSPPAGRPSRVAVAVIAASLIAAVAVGAAAFGGGGATSGPAPSAAAQGSLTASASDSASAAGAAFTVSATESGPGATTTLVTGRGSVDLSTGVAQMTATIPTLSSLLGGGGDRVTVVADRDRLYVNLPMLSTLTGGRDWVEATRSGVASVGGGSGGGGSVAALADPSRLLALLGTLTGHVTRVGAVPLDGVQTTEYRTTITAADIASHLDRGRIPPGPSTAAGAALQQLGLPSVPVTAWVGSDGLLRQVAVSVDMSHVTLGGLLGRLSASRSGAGGSGAGSEVTVTVGLTHYGAPVTVTVPPASDVTNLNDLFSSVHGAVSTVGGALSGMAHRV